MSSPRRPIPLALTVGYRRVRVSVPLGTFTKIKPQGVPAGQVPDRTPIHVSGLAVAVAFQDGGFTSQALVNPYTMADVDHLALKVFSLAGASESPLLLGGNAIEADLAAVDFPNGVSFGGLGATGTYRVRATRTRRLALLPGP